MNGNKRHKPIPPVAWLLGIIGLLMFITGIYFGTDKFSDPDVQAISMDYVDNKHVKHLVISSSKTIEDAQEASTSEAASEVLASSGSLPTMGSGKLITDTSKNPSGLPLYDGYTRDETYFDVDYSRFWTASGELNGLGDWTNSAAKNALSYEYMTDNLASANSYARKMSDLQSINGYWTAEGRLCVALPPGALIDPAIYEPEISTIWANEARYTDTSSWTMGTSALSYVAGKFDNSLIGMNVDCVLEDGTVIALIVIDTKALHTGVYTGKDGSKELCRDSSLQGYGHWRGSTNGTRSYVGILELSIAGGFKDTFNANKNKDLDLAGNKIVGFRCYPETKGRFQ